jgi:ribosomal protein S18 acetylase RimI-like enzyme
VLWVLEDNERAQAFYRGEGFVADGGRKELDLDGPVGELRMRRG